MARARSSAFALRAAGKVIARGVKAAAGRFSSEIPGAVKVYLGPGSNTCFVAAGSPSGQWGWTPIHAWMFETPGARHPLFGDKKRWYVQPYRPFLEEGTEATVQEAADVYADLSIAKWAADLGLQVTR